MMNYNGEDLVNVIIKRMEDENFIPVDGGHYTNEILRRIRNLNRGQLNQIVSFGDVTEWHNDRINKLTQEEE